jgi:hypothetical protein
MLTSRGLHLRISRWSPRLQSHQSLAIVAESRRPSLTIPQRSASFGATLHPISISAYRAGHGRIGPHQAALLRVRWSVNAAGAPGRLQPTGDADGPHASLFELKLSLVWCPIALYTARSAEAALPPNRRTRFLESQRRQDIPFGAKAIRAVR